MKSPLYFSRPFLFKERTNVSYKSSSQISERTAKSRIKIFREIAELVLSEWYSRDETESVRTLRDRKFKSPFTELKVWEKLARKLVDHPDYQGGCAIARENRERIYTLLGTKPKREVYVEGRYVRLDHDIPINMNGYKFVIKDPKGKTVYQGDF
jgi:hypothetical protein